MATQSAGTASGTAGHIQFSDGSGGFNSDSNAIFWDGTNNRLGVTTGSPAYSVDTTASGTIRTGTLTATEVTATTLDIGGTNITSTAAELNILDGVTSTAAELNLLDGGTSVGSSITIADADGFVINDGGTMKTIPASDIKTYASPALDDVTTGDAAVTLATSTGNITIDAQGNDTDIIFKGTDNTSDITMLTLDGSEAGAATFNNKVVATELDISGNVDIDGTLEADAITIGGTAIGSIYGVIAGSSSIVTTGALDSGSITSGFGAIDNGTSNIRSATITAETAFVPDASGGADLGTTSLEFNDLFLNDSGSIQFGDDQDTTLTHTDGTGLTLHSTNKLCFRDSALSISSSTDGQLDTVSYTHLTLPTILLV